MRSPGSSATTSCIPITSFRRYSTAASARLWLKRSRTRRTNRASQGASAARRNHLSRKGRLHLYYAIFFAGPALWVYAVIVVFRGKHNDKKTAERIAR